MMHRAKQVEIGNSSLGQVMGEREISQMSSLNHNLLMSNVSPFGSSSSPSQYPNTHYLDSPVVNNTNEYMYTDDFSRTPIAYQEHMARVEQLAPKYGSREGCLLGNSNNPVNDFGGFRDLSSCNTDTLGSLSGFLQRCNLGNYVGSQSSEQCYSNVMGYCNNRVQLHSPRVPPCGDLYCNQQCEVDSNGEKGILNPFSSSQFQYSNQSVFNQKIRTIPKRNPPQSGGVEALSCEDGIIIQGKNLKCVPNRWCKNTRNEIWMPNQRGMGEIGLSLKNYSPSSLLQKFASFAGIKGYIYFMAKDNFGCTFLQRVLDEGTCQHVEIICNAIVNYVVELMVHQSGNYLIQKLLDVCSEEQRMQIVIMVTKFPEEFLKVSLNAHGTRVIQKLIGTLKTRHQILLVTSALKSCFLDLTKDLNGNHVVLSCLLCLSKDDNKFIFDAAEKLCVEIATHRQGCCVLNQCIILTTGKQRENLVAQVAANGLQLAQDAFGNYVVQTIIELKNPSATAALTRQFKGHYVDLAMQKCSSHVVEKCLICIEESRSTIVRELLSVHHFEQVMQHPYANYVIQCALKNTKGPLHSMLVEAMQPYKNLRTSPYCKKILSPNILKH